MKGIIAKKLGMTQVYDENGVLIPVTVLQAGPCTVMEVKTKDKNGYSAVQLGFGARKAKNAGKAMIGRAKKAGMEGNPHSAFREILDTEKEFKVGEIIKADIFAAKEYVDVNGIIKGKGFQGVVKRFHFAGGRASHGGGWDRRPGSIGQKEKPANVIKGKKMPGHMGNVPRTIQNLLVVKVSPEENLLFLKGAVPGPTGGILTVRSAIKKSIKKN
ncbi:MAG TPA: 50S ribosomal protein L3 [Lentisphaeria bacterium]|nr:MAG: 50S ribosomal protein L3 [Lentisphaerae bacterium GWF2_49_21]HBC85331.1 50S ribosomal protein L3 [Lentisphaeria bacterium]